MTALQQLRQLKSDYSQLECLNTEECRFYTNRFTNNIIEISGEYRTGDPFFSRYIREVVLQHLKIINDFVKTIEEEQYNAPFIARALKYHFNCIIDSYTFACLSAKEVS